MYILYLCTLGDIEFDDLTICDRLNITLNDLNRAYNDLRRVGMLVTNPESGEEEIVNPEDFYKGFHKETKYEMKKNSLEKIKASAEDREFKKKIDFKMLGS